VPSTSNEGLLLGAFYRARKTGWRFYRPDARLIQRQVLSALGPGRREAGMQTALGGT